MARTSVAGAALAVALSMSCLGQTGLEPASAEDPYVPGLGEVMSASQMRHLKLWFAGQAGNWPLAAYEVDELEEGFAEVVRFHPEHQASPRPLAELVPEFTAGPIAALREAIARRSQPDFVEGYDALTRGCNACHESAKFSFNVITRPAVNPYSNQSFAPPR